MIILNKKARHDYAIIETIECGMVLTGSEVKSIRAGKLQLKGSYASIVNGEVFILGSHIYKVGSSFFSHEEVRNRKLLLHKKEIRRLDKYLQLNRGTTLVPLSVYLVNGRVKCEIGLAKGLKKYDKRAALKEKDIKRSIERGAF